MRDLILKLGIISELITLMRRYPEMRFCQLISNLTTSKYGTPPDIFYVEDKEFLKIVERGF